MPPRTRKLLASSLLRKYARWLAPAVYLCALATFTYFLGLPMARDRVLAWVLLGLLAFSLTDLRHVARGLIYDWAPFIAILYVYDVLRGRADSMFFSAHIWPQLHADQWIAAGHVPTVWLQEHLWHGAASIRWYDYALWFVYLTHFFATIIVAALLWALRPSRFRRYMAAVATLAMLGFATYALFPAVPPWMASKQGDLPPLQRIVGAVWTHIPISAMGSLYDRGVGYANDVAAMPSLHAAFAMLIAIFFWKSARWRWRILLALYPLAMGLALVYTAEHYVSDVLAGWVYAAVAYLIVERVADRLAERSARKRQPAVAEKAPTRPVEEPLPAKAPELEPEVVI
ncbi:MAG: phosphatase PAP2 family protein [Gaiellaceae bacterium]